MIFNVGSGGASSADKVKYNNTESGLQSDNVQSAIDEVNNSLNNSLNSIISSLNQSILLLDTSDVTTSEKTFTLEDDYTNYKELYFEIEMNYTSPSNIALFTNIIRVDTIRRDIKYTVYRTSAGGSVEGALSTKFISDNNTDVIINKTSSTFNGCRRLRIFGVK